MNYTVNEIFATQQSAQARVAVLHQNNFPSARWIAVSKLRVVDCRPAPPAQPVDWNSNPGPMFVVQYEGQGG